MGKDMEMMEKKIYIFENIKVMDCNLVWRYDLR